MVYISFSVCLNPCYPLIFVVLVFFLSGNNAPDPAMGTVHITMIPGNKVNMDMVDCLSRSLKIIDADVKTVRPELFINDMFNKVHQLPATGLLNCQKIKIVRTVSLRDNKNMTGIHRITVINCKCPV